MTTQAITNTSAQTLSESISNELQKAKQVVINIRSLENIDQQVMLRKTGDTIMCPW